MSSEMEEEEDRTRHFVGLVNAGATGYMNVILQQLFCVPGFAERFLSLPLPPGEGPSSMLFHLQQIFRNLRDSKEPFYAPRGFWGSFRFHHGNAVDLHEPEDASEFFMAMAYKTDDLLGSKKMPKVFEERFGLGITKKITLEGCPHVGSNKIDDVILSLGVRGLGNLEKSLEQYTSETQGEGPYYLCKDCNVKRDFRARFRISSLPGTLMVQLKRFDVDWDLHVCVKLKDTLTFPRVLDMAPYTDGEDSGDGGHLLYDLAGIVVHRSGDASGGHYVSYAKDRRDGRWYEFDDETVEEIELSEEFLDAECYGGYRSAYILFYDKQDYDWRKEVERESWLKGLAKKFMKMFESK